MIQGKVIAQDTVGVDSGLVSTGQKEQHLCLGG